MFGHSAMYQQPLLRGQPGVTVAAHGEGTAVVEGAEDAQPRAERQASTLSEWVEEQRPWLRRRRHFFRCLSMCFYRCGAGCLDGLWALGARFVVVDLAFAYSWSSAVTCASFLTVAVYMLEYAFDAVLQDLPSCGRCSQARLLAGCQKPAGRPGGAAPPTCGLADETVPLDPFGEAAMKLDLLGWSMLATVALVSLANSRYLKDWRCLAALILPAALLSCCVYAYFGIWDFFGICLDSFAPVDWRPYAPAGAGDWPGPPAGPARDIAEYCRALPEADVGQELDGEHLQALKVASSVKNLWAAWMPIATFSVALDGCSDVAAYCQRAGKEILDCLTWLNASSAGNSLHCRETLLDPVFLLAGCASQPYSGTDGQFGAPMGCRATVAGENFRLKHHQFSRTESGAVAFHLLSLATRGLDCPRAWTDHGQGPLQTPGHSDPCAFDGQLLALPAGGPELRPLDGAAPYLQLDFFRCVVQDVGRCSLLELGSSRTSFRSFAATACSLLLLAGVLWLLLVRALALCCPRRRLGAGLTGAARTLLASRVLWGYAIVALMQVGFSWTSFRVLWSYQISSPFVWWGFALQAAVVTSAVLYNTVQYFILRRQIMALPSNVLFGHEPAPASYRGPDLEDFKEMGSSSILYAMYFPGMVFWRFFFASWVLVSLFVALLYLFAQVLRPQAEHTRNTERLWHLLSAMLFMASVGLAHFLTRVFMQSCLLEEHAKGIRVRCLCLFSWWELMTCFLGLALGPATSLLDFLKGFFTTAVASLFVQRPNFTQFGELSDYVFCTYCASLYLERMSEEIRRVPDGRELGDLRSEGHAEAVRLDAYDEEDFGGQGELLLEEPAYRYLCPARCLCFLLLFVGVPCGAAVLLDFLRAHYGYPCEEHARFLPCWSWDTL